MGRGGEACSAGGWHASTLHPAGQRAAGQACAISPRHRSTPPPGRTSRIFLKGCFSMLSGSRFSKTVRISSPPGGRGEGRRHGRWAGSRCASRPAGVTLLRLAPSAAATEAAVGSKPAAGAGSTRHAPPLPPSMSLANAVSNLRQSVSTRWIISPRDVAAGPPCAGSNAGAAGVMGRAGSAGRYAVEPGRIGRKAAARPCCPLAC